MSLRTELRRKSLHFFAMIIPVGYAVLPESVAWRLLILGSAGVVCLDLIRLGHPRVKSYVKARAGELIRTHESGSLLGSSYLVISAIITILLFSKPIAVCALLFLTLGDTVAAIIGKVVGRVRVFNKTLEGTAACFVTCCLAGAAVPGVVLETVVAGAAVATLVELLPIPIDDNFRIPLSSGFVMQLLETLS